MASLHTLKKFTLDALTAGDQIALMRHTQVLVSRLSRYADTIDSNYMVYNYFFKQIYPYLKDNEKKLQAYSEIVRFVFDKESVDAVRHFSKLTPRKELITLQSEQLALPKNKAKLQREYLRQSTSFNFILSNLIQRGRFLCVFKSYSNAEFHEYIRRSDMGCMAIYERLSIEDAVPTIITTQAPKTVQKI